ncbi:hypothetical protein BDR07DRAFT_1400539 [Suillus spraguei]|nr:hypothetical protein BDR07DRAFT_1400539 [Suillus spraguei]
MLRWLSNSLFCVRSLCTSCLDNFCAFLGGASCFSIVHLPRNPRHAEQQVIQLVNLNTFIVNPFRECQGMFQYTLQASGIKIPTTASTRCHLTLL